MGNVEGLKNSKNMFERAAVWAVAASWLNAEDFDQAQKDAKKLLEMAKAVCDECGGLREYRCRCGEMP